MTNDLRQVIASAVAVTERELAETSKSLAALRKAQAELFGTRKAPARKPRGGARKLSAKGKAAISRAARRRWAAFRARKAKVGRTGRKARGQAKATGK